MRLGEPEREREKKGGGGGEEEEGQIELIIQHQERETVSNGLVCSVR